MRSYVDVVDDMIASIPSDYVHHTTMEIFLDKLRTTLIHTAPEAYAHKESQCFLQTARFLQDMVPPGTEGARLCEKTINIFMGKE